MPERGTFFFVHGTGVRDSGWTTLWGRVQDYARINHITNVKFKGCAWYKKLGVSVDHIADTLPPVPVLKALGGEPPSESDLKTAAWALLLEDPLFELRVAAREQPAERAQNMLFVPLPPGRAAGEMLRNLRSQLSPESVQASGVLAAEIADAAEEVANTNELRTAALAAGSPADPGFVEAVARAIVARVLAGHRSDEPGTEPAILLDRSLRDELVENLVKLLAPNAVKGAFTDAIRKQVEGFVLRKATEMGRERRQDLMGIATPALGDILYYQRRGGEILDLVARDLAECQSPVVAVGHSLGGIILVDLLSRPDHPRVDLLVTAGSQSPMLFAIDALERLRWGEPAPRPFTPWLNIYNPRDLLSFCAERVFAGAPDIWDRKVDPGVPFPESHSAYWSCNDVYKFIHGRWPS